MRKIALSSLLLATLMCVFSMYIAVAANTLAAKEHQIITGPAYDTTQSRGVDSIGPIVVYIGQENEVGFSEMADVKPP